MPPKARTQITARIKGESFIRKSLGGVTNLTSEICMADSSKAKVHWKRKEGVGSSVGHKDATSPHNWVTDHRGVPTCGPN